MKHRLRILYLEDSPNDAELACEMLTAEGIGCDVTLVGNRENFLSSLESCGFDLILGDYTLPSFDGMSALELARAKCPETPFIFVSGTIGEERAIEALKSGATDYVLKERMSRLVPAVLRAIKEREDRNEHKRVENELRASEENYRTLVDNALVGVYRSNLAGKFFFVNEAMARIFECDSPEEMLLSDVLLRYKNSADREILLDTLKREKKVSGFEVAVPTKFGNIKTIQISANLEGEVIAGMVVDVTERKNLEKQLLHSQKMEALGRLAGGVAHDFNNILTAILGYGSLLQMRMRQDDELREHVDQILGASEKAANLTQSLLAFSRKQIIDPKPLSVSEVIERIEKLLSRVIGEDIELQTVSCPSASLPGGVEELTVMADSGQLEQVIVNLATNARDAMPQGGTLRIETGWTELDPEFVKRHGYGEPGLYALIAVSDTGVGMDENTRLRIFEPFFTTKEMGKGTGLGLSIVYGIIKQHNGFINVYSEPGKGTTFRIYLPLVRIEAKEKSREEAVSPVGGTETVLVADDDAVVRTLMKTVLEEFGYTVIEAADGEEAVRRFMENADGIQLLILDVIMPKKNGKEVSESVMKLRPDARILFASGYPAEMIYQRDILEEGSAFFLKPFSPNELLRKVRQALDR